jgi:uncharacterized Tic20 family protein
MTEPPRPSWDGTGGTPDPTAPLPPSASPAPGGAPGPEHARPTPPPPPGGYPPPSGYPAVGHPAGGYAPPGAYQTGPGATPRGYPSADDKTWALIAHFGGAVGAFFGGGVLGLVGPLIAYLAKGQQSPAVRAHAVAALNFQLLWSIIGFAGWVLGTCLAITIVGLVVAWIFFLAPLAAWLMGTIFGIIAGVKANEGELYRYPMSINIIK